MTKHRRQPSAPGARVAINGRTLSASQQRLWRAANDDLASSDIERRKRGHIALRALESDLVGGELVDRIEQGLDESIALERRRGESIELSGTCLVMTMRSAPNDMRVPALIAFEGMITSRSSQKDRMRLIIRHAADVWPPFVSIISEIFCVGPILSRTDTNGPTPSAAI